MNSAIILAGGDGNRINSSVPKQFIEINNKKLIDFSIDAFEKNKNIDEIIIVLNKKWIEKYTDEYKSYILTVGGNSRSHSSLNGLLCCSEKSKNVLIHDAARPLLSQDLINNCIKYLSTYVAATPFIDISDSLIEKNNNKIKYINRDLIKKIQTPQAFNTDVIKEALKIIDNYGKDDISTLLNHNSSANIKFFKGSKNNFKITNDNDLKILEYIINEK
tara:strand:- start:637 stop:1290 length:654 start_codon:yes stop_codon:yes gene_type:complete